MPESVGIPCVLRIANIVQISGNAKDESQFMHTVTQTVTGNIHVQHISTNVTVELMPKNKRNQGKSEKLQKRIMNSRILNK